MTKETKTPKTDRTKRAAPEVANREGGAAPVTRPAKTAPARAGGRLRRGGSRPIGSDMFVGGGGDEAADDQ